MKNYLVRFGLRKDKKSAPSSMNETHITAYNTVEARKLIYAQYGGEDKVYINYIKQVDEPKQSTKINTVSSTKTASNTNANTASNARTNIKFNTKTNSKTSDNESGLLVLIALIAIPLGIPFYTILSVLSFLFDSLRMSHLIAAIISLVFAFFVYIKTNKTFIIIFWFIGVIMLFLIFRGRQDTSSVYYRLYTAMFN